MDEKFFWIEVHVFGHRYFEKVKAENIGLAANKAALNVIEKTGARIDRIVLDLWHPQGTDH